METVLESKNIKFVKVDKELIDDYLLMINDIDIQKQISYKVKNYTKQQEIEWVNSKLENNDHCYSMIDKNTNEYIGNIEIIKVQDNIGELGICITPKMQDKHYGTEALNSFIEYAYNVMYLEGLDLYVFDSNLRAIHCYEKAGFIKIGIGKTPDDIHMKTLKK